MSRPYTEAAENKLLFMGRGVWNVTKNCRRREIEFQSIVNMYRIVVEIEIENKSRTAMFWIERHNRKKKWKMKLTVASMEKRYKRENWIIDIFIWYKAECFWKEEIEKKSQLIEWNHAACENNFKNRVNTQKENLLNKKLLLK